MKKWMYGLCLLSVLGSLSCATESDEPQEPAELVIDAFECTPLTGVYRILYAKRSGDCADLPEQTANFSGRENTSALNGNCQASVVSSEDDCDREEDVDCPVTREDGVTIGQAKLLTAFTQTSDIRIEGMVTIELSTDDTGCSATYSLIGNKLD